MNSKHFPSSSFLLTLTIVTILVIASFLLFVRGSSEDYSARFTDFQDTAADNAASWKMFDRIVVIPDLHGDYQKLLDILVGSRLAKWENETYIDEEDETTTPSQKTRPVLNWIATRTLAVQLGDMVDRGPDDRHIMDLLMKLQKQVLEKHSDSRLAIILGNHEILQLQNLTHYAHKTSADAFGGRAARQEALSPNGYLGKWLRSLPVIVEAWDTVFVHAGLTKKVAELGVKEINRLAWRDLDLNHRKEGPFIFEDSGPVWTRLMVYGAGRGDCRMVDECLDLVGRKRIVVGHTPQRAGPALMCDERLLAADVGLSRWMYNGQSIVELVRDSEENIDGGDDSSFKVAFNELIPEEDMLRHQQEAEEQEQKKKKEQQEQQEQDAKNADEKKDVVAEELQNDPSALEEIMQLMHEQKKQMSEQMNEDL